MIDFIFNLPFQPQPENPYIVVSLLCIIIILTSQNRKSKPKFKPTQGLNCRGRTEAIKL